MGNSNNGSKQVHYISPVDYQLIGKTDLIRWGELLEMKNSKTGQLTLMQEKYANNLEIYHQIVEECIKRISYTHKNLATIYGWAGDDTPDRFTNMYKVCIFFEHVSDNLKNSIKTRKSPSHPHNPRFSHAHQPTLQYFEESELINFISQLLDVFAFLQSHNITLGDITPDLCFVTKDGILKIVDRTLLYNHISVFEMARKGVSNVFLTPIELEALESDVSILPEQNKTKADVFRLGMTLLECATLQKSTQIYDWSAYKINLDLLTSRLIQVKERYSSTIYNHLREMLKFQEHKRPDFETLKKAFEEELALTIKAQEPPLRRSVTTNTSMGPKLIINQSPNLKAKQPVKRQQSVDFNHSRNASKFTLNLESVLNVKDTSQRKSKEVLEEDINETCGEITINPIPFTEVRESYSPCILENQFPEHLMKTPQKVNHFEEERTCNLRESVVIRDNGHQTHLMQPFPEDIQFYSRDVSEYQITFGKNISAPSTNQNSPRPIGDYPASSGCEDNFYSHHPSTSISRGNSISNIKNQSRHHSRNSLGDAIKLLQNRTKHRSTKSIDGSHLSFHRHSQSETKTEYYSAMSIISRQSSSRELSQFDNVGDLPTPISSQGYQGSSWKKIDILKQPQGNYPRPEERQVQENAEDKRKESIGSIFKKNVSNSPISNSKPPRPLSPNILEYLGKSSKAPAQNVIKPFSINYDEGWKEDQNVKENGGKSQFLRRTHNTISENVSTYKPKSVVKPLTYESPYEVREALGKLGTTTPSFGLKQMREEETQFNELAQEEKQINFDNHRQAEGEFSLRRDQELKGRNEFNGKEEASSLHKNTGSQEKKEGQEIDMDMRFKLAMERSKRSAGFMKNLAEKIGAKGKNSRSNSVDVSAILRNGTNLKNESFLSALSRTPIKG